MPRHLPCPPTRLSSVCHIWWDPLPWEVLKELGEPLRTLGAASKLLEVLSLSSCLLRPSDIPPRAWTACCYWGQWCVSLPAAVSDAATQVGAQVLVESLLSVPLRFYLEVLLLIV